MTDRPSSVRNFYLYGPESAIIESHNLRENVVLDRIGFCFGAAGP